MIICFFTSLSVSHAVLSSQKQYAFVSFCVILHPCFADAEFACAALARRGAVSVLPCLHQSPASNAAAAAAYLHRIAAIEELNLSTVTSRFH